MRRNEKKWLYLVSIGYYNKKFKFLEWRFLMARITIEDALKLGFNKFELVQLAVKRVVEMRKGKELLIPTSNKEIVAALREIEAGKVTFRESAPELPEVLTGEPDLAEDVIVEETGAETSTEDSEGSEEPEDMPDVQDEDTGEET